MSRYNKTKRTRKQYTAILVAPSNHRVLRKQYKDIWYYDRFENKYVHVGKNSNLSDLYLDNKCIPFDEMPFCSGLKNHVPSLSDLFDCLDVKGREHELLAWVVQNNTERENILFTPLEKTEDGKYKLDNIVMWNPMVATLQSAAIPFGETTTSQNGYKI